MNETGPEVKRQRQRYSEVFKQDAVRLIVEEQYSFKAASAALGVSEQSLRGWHAKLAPRAKPCGDNATAQEFHEEIKRLRKELRRAELERDILKKATAYFAKESL